MRQDDGLKRRSFLSAEEWTEDPETGANNPLINARVAAGDEIIDGKLRVHALSGHERNHLFLNSGNGKEFLNVSALSALDDPADSRAFALLDYDRDGWQDIVLINADNPLSRLYRNELGSHGRTGGIVAIRFKGGNKTTSASKWSNRDGYGARVKVRRGDETISREHRCGEGFAAQNSATMIIGLGDWKEVDEVKVRWPSGRISTTEAVPEGMLLTVHEDREEEAFVRSIYRMDRKRTAVEVTGPKFPLGEADSGEVRVYTTMATWCGSCIGHLPELQELSEAGVSLHAVPVDEEDDAAKLAAYIEKWKPPYNLRTNLSTSERQAVNAFFQNEMNTESPVLPSSVITDRHGRVLDVIRGIPTLSDVRKHL